MAVAAVGWGANQFAPLILMYRSTLGVSAATTGATYGVYAAGLIPGLLLGGPVSDRLGRRRVTVWSLLVSAVASAVLVLAEVGVVWLFVGRLIAGVASGIAFSSGTAWLKELSVIAGAKGNGARRSTVAMTSGFAVGPLVAGLLAQYAPAPMIVAYLPHIVLTLIAVALVARAPETREPNPDVRIWQSLHLHEDSRRRFLGVVVPVAPWVFGTSSIALAYLPGLVQDRLGDTDLIFSAVVTTMTMLAGILVQPLARRFEKPGTSRLVVTALVIVTVGMIVGASAAAAESPILIVMATIVLGAGYGCCLVFGLSELQELASSDNLARVTALFQAVAYTGFATPYLLALVEFVLPIPTLLVAVAVLAILTLVSIVLRERSLRSHSDTSNLR
ncbi:MFS transporter [Actinopolyspora mortivallis]|uniref:MFS transporter n=1 Tax=Actinopolyspora mortivallis TaxID=33906 RepID=UPI001C632D88|nr:MFS transporter [Actinopolyspora mortivallis]